MSHVRRLNFIDFKNGEELVLAEFEERVAFSAVELFQIENVLIERNRFLDVVDFDRDVIASVNLHTHILESEESSRSRGRDRQHARRVRSQMSSISMATRLQPQTLTQVRPK